MAISPFHSFPAFPAVNGSVSQVDVLSNSIDAVLSKTAILVGSMTAPNCTFVASYKIISRKQLFVNDLGAYPITQTPPDAQPAAPFSAETVQNAGEEDDLPLRRF